MEDGDSKTRRISNSNLLYILSPCFSHATNFTWGVHIAEKHNVICHVDMLKYVGESKDDTTWNVPGSYLPFQLLGYGKGSSMSIVYSKWHKQRAQILYMMEVQVRLILWIIYFSPSFLHLLFFPPAPSFNPANLIDLDLKVFSIVLNSIRESSRRLYCI